jgi:hypothetical protein
MTPIMTRMIMAGMNAIDHFTINATIDPKGI